MEKFHWSEVRSMYVGGITPSVGKTIAEYAFRGNLYGFFPNPYEKTYTVAVYPDTSEEHIADFLSFFNKKGEGWKVVKVNIQPVDLNGN